MKQQVAISGITREWTGLGREAEINQENLGSLLNLVPKTYKAKRQKLIQAIIRNCQGFEEEYQFNIELDFPLAYAKNAKELRFILQDLQAERLATSGTNFNPSTIGITLTPKGWIEADSFETPPALRDKAFVAMWFHDEIKKAYEDSIEPTISRAGYRPIRIDLTEHTDSIIDRVIAEIKESRFVVADFTGQRAGVYFEAGFARGLGHHVIWTCKADDLEKVHFDLKGFNTIVWETHKQLSEGLDSRIRAVVGYGPHYKPRA